MIEELRDLQERFGDERRTRIIDNAADVPMSIEDLVPNMQTVVALGDDGTLKRLDAFGGRASARETPLPVRRLQRARPAAAVHRRGQRAWRAGP